MNTGKLLSLVLACPLFLAAASDNPKKATEIRVQQLQRGDVVVIGRLGLPLGTPAVVEATVFKNNKEESFYYRFYMLRILTINGKKVEPVEIYFVNQGRVEKLPNRIGEDSESDSSAYDGKTRRLIVYEAGTFDGMPAAFANPVREEAFRDVQVWSGHTFTLETFVKVLAERDR